MRPALLPSRPVKKVVSGCSGWLTSSSVQPQSTCTRQRVEQAGGQAAVQSSPQQSRARPHWPAPHQAKRSANSAEEHTHATYREHRSRRAHHRLGEGEALRYAVDAVRHVYHPHPAVAVHAAERPGVVAVPVPRCPARAHAALAAALARRAAERRGDQQGGPECERRSQRARALRGHHPNCAAGCTCSRWHARLSMQPPTQLYQCIFAGAEELKSKQVCPSRPPASPSPALSCTPEGCPPALALQTALDHLLQRPCRYAGRAGGVVEGLLLVRAVSEQQRPLEEDVHLIS